MPRRSNRRRGLWVSDDVNLDAYLKRIDYSGSIAPTLETLELLHRLHPSVIPFENLDSLMDRPVRLQLSDIEQKLIFDKRGGYCFEHNLLFKAVLESIDFEVDLLAASVLRQQDGDPPPPLNHMLLLVDVGGAPYLADVGFGGKGPTAPLKLRAEIEQETPGGRYRLVADYPSWRLELEIAGDWRPLYVFEETPRSLEDFVPMNDFAMAAFRDELRAARADGDKRHALRDNRLKTYEKGETTTRELTTVLELREVLTGVFGIALPETDQLDPALEKALRRVHSPADPN